MIRSLSYLFFIVAIFYPQKALADVRLAVLEFQGVGVEESLLRILSDKVRAGVLHVSKGQKIKGEDLIIMTRENIQQILKDQGKTEEDCKGACEVELAKNIGADYVISGELGKVDELYVLTIKLHETSKSNLLGTENVETEKKRELLSGAQKVGAYIFQAGLNLKGPVGNSNSQVESGFSGGFSGGGSSNWNANQGGSKVLISFSSTPKEAAVLVNGKILCLSTPCSKSVTSGKHQVSIQKERYKVWTEVMELKKGSKVSANLQPEFGYLHISSSQSNVALNMDGKLLGKTPLRNVEVDAGIHTITVSDPCYTGPEYKFQSKAGKTEDIANYPLDIRPSGIDVSVLDGDGNEVAAMVSVDGKNLGESPGSFTISVCSKEVVVSFDGKESKESLSLTEKKIERIELTLGGGKSVLGDGYEAVLIPSGTFTMGCTSGDSDCGDDEKPPHKVTLTKSFYMMKSEVTQGLYQKVMGNNPSHFSSCGSTCPVEKVNWYDAVKMANRLSEREGLEKCYSINGENVRWSNRNCKGWRLPTEAEWEYAARGGEKYKYAGSNSVDGVAWYNGNSGSKTHSVCGKQVNGYGLCDMNGNVFDWVWDTPSRDYSSDSVVDPVHLDRSSPARVYRGGCWNFNSRFSRVSSRDWLSASYRLNILGFRFLRTLK